MLLMYDVWCKLFAMSKTTWMGSWITIPVGYCVVPCSILLIIFIDNLLDNHISFENLSYALLRSTLLILMCVSIISTLLIKIFKNIFTEALLYFSIAIALLYILMPTYPSLVYLTKDIIEVLGYSI